MIELTDVTKTLNGHAVLDHLTQTFEDGKIYGLRGKNGAGKTMLLRAIAGLININSGKIMIDGQKLHAEMDFPPSLGLLIENNNLMTEYTARKNLQLLAKIKKVASDEDIDRTIARVGLDPNDNRTVKQFSLGMRQRLAIAQAIFERPKLILLDEPTNAIDSDGVQQVRQILLEEKQRGATIIIASHTAEDLAVLADVIYNMAEGRIYDAQQSTK